ncbi:MAG: efflux transporter outer membrane subunit [Gammaproteobacteria bacterium]|nr:efflux transporter outer membrane subunit [Gammaproteobacteria bacterium]MBU1415484.1 efflux transporter outer membrane subunit [Gammaproteobacteria bacterium]
MREPLGHLLGRSGARTRYAATFAVALAALLAGCSVTPERDALSVPLPETFSVTGGEQAIDEHWWRDFADPQLDTLIDKALADNFSLRAAWARLRQAEAVARRQDAPLWPTLTAQGSHTRQGRTRDDSTVTRQAGLFAAYEVDLWGRVRAGSEAAGFDADASTADLQTAVITLSAAVATTWYQLVEQRNQLMLIDSQITINRQLLQLVEARFRIGQATASDVYRQRQLLAQTEGERAQAEMQRNTLAHQLAILIGEAPGAASLPDTGALPALGPLPATGVPADLVRRRPDLQAAFLRLRAADARVAVAVAARYPTLDLAAAITTPGATGGLFEGWIGKLAAELAVTLFDGGQRRAEVNRTRAVVDEAFNSYGQTLLEAIGEVEDALSDEAGQRVYLASLDNQLAHVEAVARLERRRYFQGDSDYLSVLDALRSRQSLERQQVAARRQLVSKRIALVRALAGGWLPAPPRSTAEKKNQEPEQQTTGDIEGTESKRTTNATSPGLAGK